MPPFLGPTLQRLPNGDLHARDNQLVEMVSSMILPPLASSESSYKEMAEIFKDRRQQFRYFYGIKLPVV
jgi:hypothetical protein